MKCEQVWLVVLDIAVFIDFKNNNNNKDIAVYFQNNKEMLFDT